MRFDVTTQASPEQVRRALSDFTYVEESSYGGHGTGSVRIAPTDHAGSQLHVDWSYTDITRRRDRLMLFLIQRYPMSRMISRMWGSALDRYAQSVPD